MKKIFVTGANGFIGSHLVYALNDLGFDVYRGVRGIECSRTENDILFNLSDLDSISKLTKNYEFDVIVHLAAKVGWDGLCYEDMYIENVLATGLLGYVAQTMGAKLVFSSAAIVHGSQRQIISESSLIKLDTDYARTKYDGEILLKSIHPNVCILRVGGVFGKNGPNHLGINRSISRALEGDSPVLYGAGVNLRNYIYVEDLCAKIIEVIKISAKGTYLVAGNSPISIKEMLDTISMEFLGGQELTNKHGSSPGFDQVVAGTDIFGESRSFGEALKDIRRKLV